MRSEMAALRDAIEATRKDVEAIRTMLQQAMGPRPAGPAAGARLPAPAAPCQR